MFDPVYFNYSWSLGDTWAVVSHLLRISETTQKPTKLHRYSGTHDQSDLIRRIAALLDTTGSITLTDASPTIYPSPAEVFGKPYLPAKDLWDPTDKTICYQFDGVSRPAEQNPPSTDLERLLGWAPGYEFVKVGKPLTLEQSARMLRRCRMFIGICSGMAYVAHSVRVPIAIIQYGTKDVYLRHRNQLTCTICSGTTAAIATARGMIKGTYAE